MNYALRYILMFCEASRLEATLLVTNIKILG